MSLLLSPGTYTVKLSTGSQERSQTLIVKKDPNSEGTENTIATQMETLFQLRSDLDRGAEMVNQIEIIRAQLYQLNAIPGAYSNVPAAKGAADDLDKKLLDIEENLIQRKLTGQGQDTVRWPPKLLSKINYVASGIASSDFAPTNQQREVQVLLSGQLNGLRQRLDVVLKDDLAAFNKVLRDGGITNVIRP